MPTAVTLAHPECPANIREHSEFVGGTEAMVKHVAGFAAADRLPGRHGSEHDVAAAEGIPAAPLPSGARHHLRLQQVPAHGPQHAGKSARLSCCTVRPEIDWQPEFDRAREVLERSLLKPAPVLSKPGG